ncbi:uncharacterized protein [Penaeus vannamei]|uniref:uncharacterized protein n=1 Tax=Penaeus vannamei TaxID=6689 RepID=UPI00387F97A8
MKSIGPRGFENQLFAIEKRAQETPNPRSAVLLGLLLASGLGLGSDVAMFRAGGAGKKFAGAGIVLLSTPFSRTRCAALCRLRPECVAFNYNGREFMCELLSSASIRDSDLTSDPDWTYYRQHYPHQQHIVDPCASSPCPADSVCVSYEQPTYQKFRYDLDFYMCSRHAWLLAERNAGRTTCKHGMIYGEDHYLENILLWEGVVRPYQEVFQECLDFNCRGLLCKYIESGNDQCWMKAWSSAPGQQLISVTVVPGDEWVLWFPRCS